MIGQRFSIDVLVLGGISGKMMGKINAIDSGLLRGAARLGVSLAGEVVEENLQLWLEPLYRTIMLGEEYDAPEIEEMVATTVVTLVSTGLLEGPDAFLTGFNAETDYDAPGAAKDRLFPKVPEVDPLQRLYEPDGLAARWSEADDRAFMAGFDEDTGGHFGSEKNIYPWQWKVETPGETGELAVSYSQRGIPIKERLIGYQEGLMTESDYISRDSGEIQWQDLAVLTTETGVEYTMLEIGGKTYLVRGAVKGTTIPKKLIDLLVENQGTLECHSHPYIGDLSPSKTDMMLMRMLPWQKSSVIIDPTQRMMRFDSHGAIGEELDSGRNWDYYDFMDW